MNHHKTSQRLLAVTLSAVMVLGMLPVSAAAESLPAGTGGEIVSFEALSEAAAEQAVALGTALADLNLPGTLTATVRLAADTGNPAQDSGEKDTGYTEKTVPVPVTWAASPDYDGNTAGAYVFTAEIADYTVSAAAPTITVTVQAAAVKGTITAFDELVDDVRWQNTTEPLFPETLTGTVEGQSAQIPVTWEADHDYDGDSPATGLYVFTAKPGDGYALASGVEAPRITVYIPTAKRMMLRMAGNGTTQPLEITTATQLAEIAVLVNAGRLESFLANDSTATITLKLVNSIDLSAYGESWNGGKGWEPIGLTEANPFKGVFDGNNYEITGLYVNRPSESYIGLFSYIRGGTVKNLGLKHVRITGGNYVGCVTGSVGSNNSVTNCYVAGSVSGTGGVGGVAGDIYGSVTNCHVIGSVSSTDSSVGGVAGYIRSNGSVTNCYATASVSGTGSSSGGVAGNVNGNITSCYATGSVSGKGNNVGGVAGSVGNGSVINCYAASSVSGSASSVGGVAGSVINNGSVTNCYATGAVSGTDKVGGVTGSVMSGGRVESCAALNPSVRCSVNVGRVVGTNVSGTLSGNRAFAGMTPAPENSEV